MRSLPDSHSQLPALLLQGVSHARALCSPADGPLRPGGVQLQRQQSHRAQPLQGTNLISFLPSHNGLRSKLRQILTEQNGGLGFDMWATILDRDGKVVDIVFSGNNRGDQWPGSRVISAQKANTANAFSLKGFALSTANLYAAVQPGGSLFGLQESNPVDPEVAYGGNAADFGTTNDFMIGKRIGGINVFGGGLALYTPAGTLHRRHRPERRYRVHRSHHRLEAAALAEPGQRAGGAGAEQHRQFDLCGEAASTGSSTRSASTWRARATTLRSSTTCRPPTRWVRESRD